MVTFQAAGLQAVVAASTDHVRLYRVDFINAPVLTDKGGAPPLQTAKSFGHSLHPYYYIVMLYNVYLML